MMKLASHNSLTYFKPQWWVRIFNFIPKCQEFNLIKQYNIGVRYFDFRFKYIKGEFKAVHGLAIYKMKEAELFELLDKLNSLVTQDQNIVNIRLVFEYKRISYDEEYINYIQKLKSKFKNIYFSYGYKTNKKNWIPIENCKIVEDPPQIDCHWQLKKDGLGWPSFWARRHNSKIRKLYKDKEIKEYIVMDFVGKY